MTIQIHMNLYHPFPKIIHNPDDFYLISKKYEWLISECHENIGSCVGALFHQNVIEELIYHKEEYYGETNKLLDGL